LGRKLLKDNDPNSKKNWLSEESRLKNVIFLQLLRLAFIGKVTYDEIV